LLHQKSNDLLIVWSYEKTEVGEMLYDANYFLEGDFYISLDGEIFGEYFPGGFSKES